MTYLEFRKIYFNKMQEILVLDIYINVFMIEYVYYDLINYITLGYLKDKSLGKESF